MAYFVFYKKKGQFLTKAKDGFIVRTCSFMKVKISMILLNYQLFLQHFTQICQTD